MQEKVEAYLERCSHERKLKEDRYRYYILKEAGLLCKEEDYVEISQKEYERYLKDPSVYVKQEEGKYFIKANLPLDVTDEEFAAVEKEIPEKKRNQLKQKAFHGKKERTDIIWARYIFWGLACFIWIAGLIAAIMNSVTTINVSYYFPETHFSFTNFVETFVQYLLYGAGCLFLGEACLKFHENKQKA